MTTSGFVYQSPLNLTPIFNPNEYIYQPFEFNPTTLTLIDLIFESINGDYYTFTPDTNFSGLFLEIRNSSGSLIAVNTLFSEENLKTSRQIQSTYFLAAEGAYISDIKYPDYGMLCDNYVDKSGIYLSNKTDGTFKMFVKTVDKVTVSPTSVSFADTILTNNGSNTVPAYSFTNDPNTGMYNSNPDTISLATGGLNRLIVSPQSITTTNTFRVPDGSVSAPTFGFTLNTSTGMYRVTSPSEQIRLSVNGSDRMTISGTTTISSNNIRGVDGFDTSPSYSFGTASDTGMYLNGLEVNVSTAGVRRLGIGTSAVTTTLPIRTSDGTVSAPSHSFSSDTNTGMYSSGADNIGFSCNGVNTLNIASSLITTPITVQVGTGNDGRLICIPTNIANRSGYIAFQPQNNANASGYVGYATPTSIELGAYGVGRRIDLTTNAVVRASINDSGFQIGGGTNIVKWFLGSVPALTFTGVGYQDITVTHNQNMASYYIFTQPVDAGFAPSVSTTRINTAVNSFTMRVWCNQLVNNPSLVGLQYLLLQV